MDTSEDRTITINLELLPLDSTIQITSTKKGIKATDTDGKIIGG